MGSQTIISLGTAVLNSQTVHSIGYYSTGAGSNTLKLVKRNSAGNYDVIVSQAVSHGGGGWQDFVLTSDYVVPGTGDYYIGLFTNAV